MNFSLQKKVLLKPEKSRAMSTFLIGILCAACFFLPHMIMDRGYFLFYGDFNVQQIPFYQLCHDAIKSGEIGWSFYTDLGANFIGSYTFYLLGSPFFWLTLLFPNWMVPYLMGPLLILKFGCAALTAYLYIARFTRHKLTASLGGLLYAFSGFSVYNVFFNHFHEAIIIFPLLLLGFELLITEKRPGIFALMVCFCGIFNYFFFFGMMVFGVIYFVIRLISGAIKPGFSLFIRMIFEAVLGVAMAAVLLIPSYLAIIGVDRLDNITLGWNSLLFGKESIYANVIEVFFFPPDIPARPVFFPQADVKWASLGGWLPVFSMVGVFTYCSANRGNWIKRLIATSAVFALVPILNASFSAFNDAYYARWFYMPVLIMCLATSMALEDEKSNFEKGFWLTAVITLIFTLVIGFFPETGTDENGIKKILRYGLYTTSDDPATKEMYIFRFWLTCFIALAGLAVLYMLLRYTKKNFIKFLKTAIICVTIFSVAYANFFIFSGKSHAYEDKIMIDDLIENELHLPGDKDTYRIDVYSGVDNTAMFLNYQSINCFHSIVPPKVTEFYEFIGEERGVASRPTVSSYAIRPLLSVKYLLARSNADSFEDKDSTLMTGYNFVEELQGFKIYENENYIGYGFSYDEYMTYQFCEEYNAADRAKVMLKAIMLSPAQIEKYGHMLENIETSDGYIDLSDYQMKNDAERLNLTSATSFKLGKNSFKATVERDKPNLVFFSIPYDEGWTAYVNGKKTDVENVNIGFMAVAVGEGVSEIEFRYETPGLKAGIIISVTAVIVLIFYVIIYSLYARRHGKTCHYPEGEKLLSDWKKAEKAEELEAWKNCTEPVPDIKLETEEPEKAEE